MCLTGPGEEWATGWSLERRRGDWEGVAADAQARTWRRAHGVGCSETEEEEAGR